jgi:hypothetical protein
MDARTGQLARDSHGLIAPIFEEPAGTSICELSPDDEFGIEVLSPTAWKSAEPIASIHLN